MAYITLPNWSMRLHLDVTVHSQSIANNTTTFRALLRVQDPYNNWPHNLNANSMSWSVRSPNGTTHRSGSGTFDFRQYEWLTLSDTHITFGHNADGSFTARQWTGHFSNSGPIGSGVVTIGSVGAPTIPRATTPSWSGNFVTGTAKSISLPRPPSSGFTHDVAYRFGTSGNYTNIATGAGVTATWNPGHALASNFPNATYGTGQIRVITKSGSTTVGTKTASFRVDAAGSIVPTISSVTWDDSNPNVKNLVGAFVQGQSLVKGSVTAAGAHGSTIKAADRTLIIGGQPLRESDLWQPTTAGTITASGRVLDSRSRVGTLAANFEVLPYSPPSISNGLTIVRRATNSAGAVGEGSFLRMDLTAAVSSLKPSTAEKNTFHLRVRTRPVGGAWTTRNNGVLTGLTQASALVMVAGGAAFPTATSFEVEIRVTDALGNYSEVIRRVATIAVSMDLADTGIGVGKIWERGALDVGPGGIYDNGLETTGYKLTPKHVNDLPSSYPDGTSMFSVVPALAWPAGWGTTVTHGSGFDRMFQLHSTNGGGGLRYRGSVSGGIVDEWAEWVPLAESIAGQVTQFAGDTAPSGWLLCQGQAISRTTYAALYGVLGNKYGAGDGTSTFNVPDLRGRVAAGLSSDTEFNTLGKKTGAKTHTLTTAQMPKHKHSVTGPSGGVISGAGGGGSGYSNGPGYAPWFGGGWNAKAAVVSDAGSGSAHNNIQPTITLNYIIKT